MHVVITHTLPPSPSHSLLTLSFSAHPLIHPHPLILPSPSHPPLTLSSSPHPLILPSPSHPPLTLSSIPHYLIFLALSFSFTHLTSYLSFTSSLSLHLPPPPLPLHRPRGSAVGERLWSPQDVTNTTDADIRLHNQRCRMVR